MATSNSNPIYTTLTDVTLILIARLLEMPIERTDELDFFLEPFEASQQAIR